MFTKLVASTIAASVILAAAPMSAQAADAPKTKTECLKVKNMKWDTATKTCIKK